MRKLIVLLLVPLVLSGGCALRGAGSGREGVDGSVDWLREDRVVRVTYCCGLVSEHEARADIPEAQIWGDGRVVRVERDAGGSRRVLSGRLSRQALEALLRRVVGMGFFSLEAQYSPELAPTDYPNRCIEVDLAQRSRQVSELYEGAPDSFSAMYAILTGDLGIQRGDYMPERGYLSGFALEEGLLRSAGVPVPEPDLVWPEQVLGMSAGEAIKGVWIEGEPLEIIWQTSHRAPFHLPVVAGDGGIYRLVVQVPGVSWIEPPEPAPSPGATPVGEAAPKFRPKLI